MAYIFKPNESVDHGIRRCSSEQLVKAERSLREDFEDDPVESVHAARKSVKKQRALLRISRAATPAARRRRENAALRDAARQLSGARDADVMLETVDDLAARYQRGVPEETFTLVREDLERRQVPDDGGSTSTTVVQAVADELRDSRERIAKWEISGGGWRAIEPGLLRTYKTGRKAFARAAAEPSDAALHEWRKRTKDLWYGLRLLASVGGKAVDGHAKEAHRLADLLGDDHDLAVLADTLSEFEGLAADRESVLRAVAGRRRQLHAQAMCAGRRVYAEKPSAFRRRMRVLWRAGRKQAKADASRGDSRTAAGQARSVSALV